ncbi:DUF4148 domain-containing protein [Duganella sp. PWIR1]
MSTTTKHLLTAAATVAFAIAATATTVSSAFAQTAPATTSTAATAAATSAAKNAVATSALASVKIDQPVGKTRAEVQAEFLEARKNGTLLETEADFDVARTRKHYTK